TAIFLGAQADMGQQSKRRNRFPHHCPFPTYVAHPCEGFGAWHSPGSRMTKVGLDWGRLRHALLPFPRQTRISPSRPADTMPIVSAYFDNPPQISGYPWS